MRIPARALLIIDRICWIPYRMISALHMYFGGVDSQAARPTTVLVIKLIGLGSLIKFASLCEEQGVDKSKLTLVTFARHQEFCSLFGFGRALFIRTSGPGAFIRDCWTTIYCARTQQPSIIVDYERCSSGVGIYRTILAWICRCPTISFEEKRRVHFRINDIYPVEEFTLHQLFLKGIEVMPKSAERSKPRTVSVVRNKVLVNINASDYLLARRYPIEAFAKTLQSLHRHDTSLEFHLTGAPDEAEYVERVVNKVPNIPVSNKAGKWTLDKLVLELSDCALFITGDSGPLHLAAFMNVPTLAVWGPTQAFHFGYTHHPDIEHASLQLPCSPCLLHPASRPARACLGRISCLRDLRPAVVAQKAIALMTSTPQQREINFPERMRHPDFINPRKLAHV